jgi:hypothetical protein
MQRETTVRVDTNERAEGADAEVAEPDQAQLLPAHPEHEGRARAAVCDHAGLDLCAERAEAKPATGQRRAGERHTEGAGEACATRECAEELE